MSRTPSFQIGAFIVLGRLIARDNESYASHEKRYEHDRIYRSQPKTTGDKPSHVAAARKRQK